MYLGVLTAILGWAAWFGSPALALYAAGVGLMFHGMVGLYEEPRLAREFGAAYAEYWARVPRWLPRTRPRLNRG
jgi:protein-S-isoprenylcysteine O-methyltransferase Ste14